MTDNLIKKTFLHLNLTFCSFFIKTGKQNLINLITNLWSRADWVYHTSLLLPFAFFIAEFYQQGADYKFSKFKNRKVIKNWSWMFIVIHNIDWKHLLYFKLAILYGNVEFFSLMLQFVYFNRFNSLLYFFSLNSEVNELF